MQTTIYCSETRPELIIEEVVGPILTAGLYEFQVAFYRLIIM